MAKEEGSPPPAVTDDGRNRAAQGPGTFPAGAALLALGVSFILVRIILPFSATSHANGSAAGGPSLGSRRTAVVSGIMGALLAGGGVVAMILEGARGRGERAWAMAVSRLIVAAPLLLLVLYSLAGDPPERLRWWALYSTAATITIALGVGLWKATRLWFARGSLALLLVGQLIELAWPPAHLAAVPGSFWPRLTDRLGSLSELCAFLGAGLAVAWAVTSTKRLAGGMRVLMFLPFPALTAVLLTMLVSSVRPRFASAVAVSMFGVRFDLLAWASRELNPTLPQLLLYLLVPELLLCTAVISFGSFLTDRGAAVRRGLGWLAILLGGFGALTLAAPMDPTRLVTVAMAAVLLERAATIEGENRLAPA